MFKDIFYLLRKIKPKVFIVEQENIIIYKLDFQIKW